jgi:hypothetical protein
MSEDAGFLSQFFSPDRRHSLVIEDNGRVGYAYLLDHDNRICADVWLYNRGEAPAEPEWKDSTRAPFANPAQYVSPLAPFTPPQNASACSVRWQQDEGRNAVIILINDTVAGMLEPSQRPGWASGARADGPLARALRERRVPRFRSPERQHLMNRRSSCASRPAASIVNHAQRECLSCGVERHSRLARWRSHFSTAASLLSMYLVGMDAKRWEIRSKMAEGWGFYFTRVNDVVSSIFVDLALRKGLPFADRSRLLWVWVYFNSPRPDGLASADEAPELFKIEDKLVPAIQSECSAQFVGRITGAGRREFYFYSAPTSTLEPVVQQAMASFPAYNVDFGEQSDSSWRHYEDVLYPTPREMNSIRNQRVLAELEKHGDDHSISRPVDHWAYFKSHEARASVARALAEKGFSSMSDLQPKGSTEFRFGLQFQRSDRVDSNVINAVTCTLEELVTEHGGEYDGWETQVVKPK